MNDKKLSIKDLVTIGTFAIVYTFVLYVVGIIELVPVLVLVYPALCGIVSGVVVMLFMAKVQKPWALFILGIIDVLLIVVMGHSYIILIISTIMLLIAEYMRKLGNYNSFKYNMFAFGFFNMWLSSAYIQMLFTREQFFKENAVMGEQYLNTLEKMLTNTNIILICIGAFVGGLIGAYLGKLMLKKHFKKSGII